MASSGGVDAIAASIGGSDATRIGSVCHYVLWLGHFDGATVRADDGANAILLSPTARELEQRQNPP